MPQFGSYTVITDPTSADTLLVLHNGTVKQLKLPHDAVYASWFGSTTSATIAAALTAIGTTNKATLVIGPGTWTFSGSVDWSTYTNVTFEIRAGAVFSHGVNTINIPNRVAGRFQWLDGTGLVTFSGKVGVMYPEEFGASINETGANNVTALTKAMATAKATGLNLRHGIGKYILNASYPGLLVDPVGASLQDCNGVTISGESRTKTIIETQSAAGADVFNMGGSKNITIEHLAVSSNLLGGSADGSNAFTIVNGAENITIQNVHIYPMPYVDTGAELNGGSAFTIQSASATLNHRNIRFINNTIEGTLPGYGAYGVNISLTGAGFLTNPPTGIIISGNKWTNTFAGFLVQYTGTGAPIAAVEGMQIDITNNSVVQCQQFLQVLGITGLNFVGNTCNTSYAAGNPGWTSFNPNQFTIYCLSNHRSNFNDNIIRMANVTNTFGFASVGGGAEGVASTPSDRLNFVGNVFHGDVGANYGIRANTVEAYGFVTRSNFDGNTFEGNSLSNYDPTIYRPELTNTVVDTEKGVIPTLSGLAGVSGADLVTNGTAWTGASGSTPPTGWVTALASNYSIVGGQLQMAISGVQDPGMVVWTAPTLSGRKYLLTYAFTKGTGTAGEIYLGTSAGANDVYASGNLTNTSILTRKVFFTAASANTSIALLNRSAVAGDTSLWDNVSLVEVAISTTGDILVVGNVLSSGGAIGYTIGAGGTVTQLTSKSTGVTLSKATGNITMTADALGADTIVSFVLTNTLIAPTDHLVPTHVSGGTLGKYHITAACNDGYATIYVTNISTGSLSEAIVIKFSLIKAAIT